MIYYQTKIKALTDADPRHVEAWMRSANGTLDSLSPEEFLREVRACAECAKAEPELSDTLAGYMGIQ